MVEIKVPGVKAYRSKGRLYVYHRKTGEAIKERFGTAAFLAKVEELNGTAPPDPKDGTLGGLIRAYKASPEFTGLAERTRADYQKIFDYIGKHWGKAPVIDFSQAKVIRMRDRAFEDHKRRFANYVVQVTRIIFAWGRPREWYKGENPAVEVPLIRRPRDARKVNRAWKQYELTAALEKATGALRVGVALGMFAGMSEGDVIRFPWSGYDGERIRYARRKTGVQVSILAHRDLRTILDKTEKRGTIIVVGKRGSGYTENGFRAMFFKLVRDLVEQKKVEPGLTFHGLRHTVGKFIIDAGGDTRDVASVLGHATEKMAQEYSAEADRERRGTASIRRLERKKK
jgi:integrase